MRPLLFFTVSLLTFSLDQVSKALIPGLIKGGTLEIIPGLLNLVYVRNPGVAFGLLGDLPPSIRLPFLILISIGAIVVVLYIYFKEGWYRRVKGFALSFILGGITGNLLDRVRDGAVTDLIDLHIGKYHWPAFNMADTAITTGVILLLFGVKHRESQAEVSEDGSHEDQGSL